MKNESVVGLIKDLTAKLSAVAEEFNERASLVGEEPASGDPLSDAALTRIANALIDQRKLRRRFVPAELFHEPAWDMLLALYVARHDEKPMNVKTLVATADAPVTTSQRWVEHLHKLKLIDRVIDPADRRRIEVSLSDTGERALADYLAKVGEG